MFESNEACATALFQHLYQTGEIEGTERDREDIIHDINNLRGHEWLECLDRNLHTKPFFDYLSRGTEFSAVDEIVTDDPIPPDFFLKVVLGREFPETVTFDEVRTAMDENGLSELWDFPTDEIDEATNNLGDDMSLVAVSFYQEDGYFARVFEVTEEMAGEFLRLELAGKSKGRELLATRSWISGVEWNAKQNVQDLDSVLESAKGRVSNNAQQSSDREKPNHIIQGGRSL